MSTQTSERTVIDNVKKQLFIGGEWRDAKEGGTLAVEDPATGESLCEVADAQPEDSLAALDAAVEAQADWANRYESPSAAAAVWISIAMLMPTADSMPAPGPRPIALAIT